MLGESSGRRLTIVMVSMVGGSSKGGWWWWQQMEIVMEIGYNGERIVALGVSGCKCLWVKIIVESDGVCGA